MKKIDTWLSIQRYVSEASQSIPFSPVIRNVEVWGTVRRSAHEVRKNRAYFIPEITTL